MYLKELKTELKSLATEIKHNRSAYREGQRTKDFSKMTVPSWKIDTLSSTFRTKHIAYCLLRGRNYAEIENKVREGNEPRWDVIDDMVAKGLAELFKEKEAYDAAKAVRPCAG